MRNEKGQFVKGAIGNPSGSSIFQSETRDIARANKKQVLEILNRIFATPAEEIQKKMSDKSIPMLELMLMGLCVKAATDGDAKRILFAFGYSGVGFINPDTALKNLPGGPSTDSKVVVMLPSNGREKQPEPVKEVVPDEVTESGERLDCNVSEVLEPDSGGEE